MSELRECLVHLGSAKVTERRKASTTLPTLLDNEKWITYLNEHKEQSWDDVLDSVNKFLLKEAQKLLESEQKSKFANTTHTVNLHANLLFIVVQKANKEEARLNVSNIINLLFQCFESSVLKKYFLNVYLTILRNHVLSVQSYVGEISADEWTRLLTFLKDLHDNPPTYVEESTILKCLQLLFKWGPLHRLPEMIIRQQFLFVSSLCQQLNSNCPRWQQESTIKLALEFCKQTGNDCRTACCKLGEEVFPKLIALYEKRTHDNNTKIYLFKFFLLQIQIHHPRGASEGNNAAYAYSWIDWKKCLRTLYSISFYEINNNRGIKFKPAPLFRPKEGLHVLHETFADLTVEVFHQLYNTDTLDVSQTSILDLTQHKRPRMEVGIELLTSEIQSGKDWPLINVMTCLLKRYPEMIKSAEEIQQLLKVLSYLQSQCRDADIRSHVYQCLSVLVEVRIEEQSPRVKELWLIIWEQAVRAMGFNQNEAEIHTLLQKLILRDRSLQSAQFFRSYVTGVVALSPHSISTLNIACSTFSLSQLTNTTDVGTIQNQLLGWIFNPKSEICSSVYTENITAQVSIFLTLKQWPEINAETAENLKDSDVEDIYLMNSFQTGFISMKTNKVLNVQNRKKNYLIHKKSLEDFWLSLNKFISKYTTIKENKYKTLENLVNLLTLISNLLSHLLEYGVIADETFNECALIANLSIVLQSFVERFVEYSEHLREMKYKHLTEVMKQLNKLFSSLLPELVANKLREITPTDFLCCLFNILNGNDEKEDNDWHTRDSQDSQEGFNDKSSMRLVTMEFLCCYCFTSGSSSITETQIRALKAIANPDYNFKLRIDYELVVTFLGSIHKSKPGVLPDDVLHLIIECIERICRSWFSNYTVAVRILQILYDVFPHIAICHSQEIKDKSISILYPFCHITYGPKVVVKLINCMGQFAKIDPNSLWTNFSQSGPISNRIPQFLNNNFHEVRLCAIKNVTILFSTATTNCMGDMERRKNIFKAICTESENVLTLDNINEVIKKDEISVRTASVFHTFGVLLGTSTIWERKALFALLQLAVNKNLEVELLRTFLNMVANSLNLFGAKEFLELHVNYLVDHWYSKDNSLKSFPYHLYGCANEMEFYKNYTDAVTYILIKDNNDNLLERVCETIGKTVNEIVENIAPTIIALRYAVNIAETHASKMKRKFLDVNKLYENLVKILSTKKILELCVERIDDILVQLMRHLFDPEDFKKFDVNFMLPEPDGPYFSKNVITEAIKLFESQIGNDEPIIPYCMENCANKLQTAVLKISISISKATSLEEQITAFHHFVVLCDLIIPSLQTNHIMNTFLIRQISYTLIHLINNNCENDSILNVISSKYLLHFLKNVLPASHRIVQKFVVVFVSILTPISRSNTRTAAECLELLNFFIVDNNNSFFHTIKQLDPFPNESRFEKIQEVVDLIKRDDDNLVTEIEHFLMTGAEIGNIGCRIEGLRHLHTQLSRKKAELQRLYADLYKLRGFSEDCQTSILHQLICMLVKLTASTDSSVSLEAAACLGELGPADLTTLVLQVKDISDDLNHSPFEIVTKHIVTLLVEYIVDHNINVVQTTSDILYKVLDSREGKEIEKKYVEKPYIIPFVSKRYIRGETRVDLDPNCVHKINDDDLWCPLSQKSHSEWITELVQKLLNCFTDHSYLKSLIPLIEIKTEFAENVLPLLIFLILCTKNSNYIKITSAQMQKFFTNHWNGKNNVTSNPASVQCMLNIVNFMRLHVSDQTDSLQLNYLHVARAAQFCTAHFTAILYVELWCQEKFLEYSDIIQGTDLTVLDLICEKESDEIKNALQMILREAYQKVGDLDALHGCGINYLLATKFQIEHGKQMKRWDQVLLNYDLSMSCDTQNAPSELLQALKNCSLYHLPLKYDTEIPQYECAWRLGEWNISNTNAQFESPIDNYEKNKYLALKALHENDATTFDSAIINAKHLVIDSLRHASLESCKNLYTTLTQLQSLQEIEDFKKAKLDGNFDCILEKWKLQDKINRNDFQYVEPIYAHRIALLEDIAVNFDEIKTPLIDMKLQLADLARSEAYYHVADRTLGLLLRISDLPTDLEGKIIFQQAQLCWINDKTTGRQLLRHLLKRKECNDLRLKSAALKLHGSWMVESRSENAQTIISNYFMKSLKILNDLNKTSADYESIVETNDALARFADVQYQHVLSYIKSTIFERKVENKNKSSEAAAAIRARSKGSTTKDESRAIITYERQCNIDEKEINDTHTEKTSYLILAVKFYLKNLKCSDIHNIRVFRILSLWIENRNDEKLQALISTHMPKIPSYKFIPILPQLVPHITNIKGDKFANEIFTLLERCAKDHPHHTLPIVLALTNANQDKAYSTAETNTASNEARMRGARMLISKLQQDANLKQLIVKMQFVSEALIEFAYLPPSKEVKSGQNISIPAQYKIHKIKTNFNNVLVPTHTLAINKSKSYDNIPGIDSFSSTYCLVGGLNAPKRITCRGRDGISRMQLVKGKDDLRQDAVMQQVFTIMNGLLASNKRTEKLLLRTYKVVPLSQRSGILEWVENSMPISEYLLAAHAKYNARDWKWSKCRLTMEEVSRFSHERKLIAYKKICSNFRPVFHKFFETSFPQPTVWYERRRAYMHSVAASSMCGYILGLGDRHVNNILIDKSTAEVIHIDFGIAFEQGRVLPTPETVPFRLTRDIEAGMGVCGIEGIFRRSCEKTMEVLRQNAETIITILEVLLYDPLYAWTVTPAEAYNRQFSEDENKIDPPMNFNDDESASVNVTAERALLKLRQKLQGTEEGGSTSVEGQVEKLLQQARDPANLCKLFYGWQPYL